MEREEIIKDYVHAYNTMDVGKMITYFDKKIKFRNISNGVTNMVIDDLNSFKSQAEQAKNYFQTRHQIIKSWKHEGSSIEIEIEYSAVLAVDFPNGLKKGDKLHLQGKSIFKFSEDKIIELTDIS